MKKWITTLLLIAVTACLWGGSTELNLKERLGEVEDIKVEIDFGMGELKIGSGDRGTAVSGLAIYNPEDVEVNYSYREHGDTGMFELDTDWDNHDDHDDHDNIDMELFFTPRVPLDMNLDLGMGEGHFDFHDLKISGLELECGLGEAEIEFGSRPNKTRCREVDIESGLGDIDVKNLVNSGAEKMNFDCGLGTMDLDFHGDLKRDIMIDISIGLGAMDIMIPEGTNVIFNYEGSFFADLDLGGFEKLDDDEYRSMNFRKGRPTLVFEASIGMGSIDVHWVD